MASELPCGKENVESLVSGIDTVFFLGPCCLKAKFNASINIFLHKNHGQLDSTFLRIHKWFTHGVGINHR